MIVLIVLVLVAIVVGVFNLQKRNGEQAAANNDAGTVGYANPAYSNMNFNEPTGGNAGIGGAGTGYMDVGASGAAAGSGYADVTPAAEDTFDNFAEDQEQDV
jgi:hypothetical protein